MVELKCLTCIHGELCLEQKGGIDLCLASDNDCKCYKSTNEYKEVKHGEWIDTRSFDYHKTPIYQCSECRKEVADSYINLHKYCLHCGAEMDGGKK